MNSVITWTIFSEIPKEIKLFFNGIKMFSIHKHVENWLKEIKCNFQFFSDVTISMSLYVLVFVPKILLSIPLPLKSVFKIQFKFTFFLLLWSLCTIPQTNLSYHTDGDSFFVQYPNSLYNTSIIAVIISQCSYSFVCLQWQPKNSLRTKTHFCSVLDLWCLTLKKCLLNEGKTTW